MKKIFTLAMLACLSMGAWAQTPFATETWNGETTFPVITQTDGVTNVTKYVFDAIAPICVQQENVAIEAGTLKVTFQYTSGSWGLDIVGVDLVKDGVVVKSDYHNAFTGSNSDHNTFTLSDVAAGTYTIRYWVPRKTHDGADLTTTGDNSQGTITYTLNDAEQSQFTNKGWTINTTFRSLANATVPAELWKVMRTELFGTRGWKIAALSDSNAKYENNNGVHYYDHTMTLENKDIYVYYRFSGGSHALAIKGVELLDANGKTVAVDCHNDASTGNNKSNCTFKLSAPEPGEYTVRTVAEGSGGWSTQGNIYYYTQYEVDTKFSAVKAALNANKIGYPKASNANAEAIISYDTENEHAQLCDHLYKVYGVADINLPVPGKAYRIVFVDNNGAKNYIQTLGNAGNEATAAEFVCGKDGEKFIFILKDGSKFMNYQGANTALGAYNTEYNSFTIQPLATSGSAKLGTSTAADRFGYVYLTASQRSSSDSQNGCMIIAKSNGGYDNSTAPFFNENYTSAITFEEVTNDVYVKLTNPNASGTSSLDNKYVGTFSAPYHVALPAGVKAYTAAIGGTTVNFTELGTTVPANTGVLLYAEGATDEIIVNAVPAGTATAAGSNAFAAVINGNIAAGDFVLGNGTNGVGFYARETATTAKNKAYIPASAASNLNAFRFDFEGEVTGIEAIENNSVETVFDLQGRRVQDAKSGLYIVNGKKVIR